MPRAIVCFACETVVNDRPRRALAFGFFTSSTSRPRRFRVSGPGERGWASSHVPSPQVGDGRYTAVPRSRVDDTSSNMINSSGVHFVFSLDQLHITSIRYFLIWTQLHLRHFLNDTYQYWELHQSTRTMSVLKSWPKAAKSK